METALLLFSLLLLAYSVLPAAAVYDGEQSLSRIAIHRAMISLDSSAYINASPSLLGRKDVSIYLCGVRFSSFFLRSKAILMFDQGEISLMIFVDEGWRFRVGDCGFWVEKAEC